MRGQSSPSFVPNVIKTTTFLNDDLAQKELQLQRHRERIESYHNKTDSANFVLMQGAGNFRNAGDFARRSKAKDSSGAILWILHYRTLSIFRTFSSSTFIMSDVQSIQFTFHHQFGFDTGRTKFEQHTDSVLSV